MKKKKLLVFVMLLNIFIAFSVNSRDYSKDKYLYDKKGLHFLSRDLGINKFYPRAKVKIKGIDVSKWQGYIDWKKVKESGVKFAIIRDGYGKKSPKQIDKYFRTNINGAKKYGIPCGVYHYSYANSKHDAVAEADFCLENIKPYKLEYPIVFDIEENRLKSLGRTKLTDICEAFCERIRSKGYYVSIYTYPDWIRNFLYSRRLFGKYDLWLARHENWQPGYICGMWQYSSKESIKGIKGNTDCSISYFDYPKIMKDLHLNGF